MLKVIGKIGWIAGIFLSAALLSGCGGGGGGGNDLPDSPDSSYVKLQSANIEINSSDNSFALDIPIIKTANVKVTLSRFNFYVGGCQVDNTSLQFQPQRLEIPAGATQGSVHVEGRFTASCTPMNYTLDYHEKSEYNGKSKEGDYSLTAGFTNSGSGGGTTPGTPGEYELFVAPDQFRVSSAGTSQTMEVQLAVYDSSGHLQPATERNVSVEVIDPQFGTVSPTRAVTDQNGRFTITYRAPNNPENYYGQQVQFDVFMTEKPEVEHPVTLVFASTDTAPVNTTGMELVAVPENVAVTSPGETRALTLYLNNNNTHRPVSGVTIAAQVFNQNNGTLNTYLATTDSNGQVVFNYTAPQTLPGSPLTITFEVDNGDPALTADVTINFTGSTPIDTTNLRLYTVPTEFNIATPGETRAIDVYVENNATNQPAAGISLVAQFFDPANGTLNSYNGTTDSNGHIVFNYTAPETLPSSDLNITFSIANGSPERTRNVTVKFQGSSPIDTTNMRLYAVPESFNVTTTGESRTIDLYVENNATSQPVEGIALVAKFFDPSKGTLNAYSGTTDANGHVIFNYTAPADSLPAGDFNITFEIANGTPSRVKEVTVSFRSGSEVNATNLQLYAVPQEFNVGTGGESRAIDLYVENNETRQPAQGITVTADFFDPANGTLDSYTATTDINGHAVFNYTAPETLPSSDLNITFRIANSNPDRSRVVTAHFQGSAPVDTSGMRLWAVPAELNVTAPNMEHEIKIYLYGGTQPVSGETIIAHVFDPNSGTLNRYSAETDSNGMAVFSYLSPAQLNASDFNITFEVLNGSPALDTNVSVHFDNAIYTITPESNITISRVNTGYQIQVALSKDSGNGAEPAVGKTVVAEFLMPIYGKIASYEAVVGSDGIALFDYTSPGKISDLNDTNITFYYKDNRQVSGETTLIFQPESVEKVERLYIVPSSITITSGSEEQNITIITVNNENMGISTEVSIEQPTNADGDYGYFEPSGPITTDSSGRATVVYHAPSSISGLSERNITFSAKVDESNYLTEDLNIIYSEGTGPGVDYEITVSSEDTLEVNMSTGQLTVTIHKRGDLSSPIANEDVLDVNVTTLFPQMIDFDGNTTFRYSGEGIKSIPVQTYTLAGTAVVRVDALIYNGDSNVTIHQEYPVVIMSGPVTAMSIFYVFSEQDEESGVFRNHYTIHAVDKYDNPARPGVALHPSVVNGTKVIRSRGLTATGKLVAGDPATFEDDSSSTIYDSVETGADGDILIVIPNATRFDRFYTGTWSITDVLNSTTLQFSDPFGPSDVDTLSYVVGGSKRYVSEYGVATADIESESGQYLTDENGNVKFIVNFDPVLAGHTMTIGAVANDGGERTGVAKIEMFRWAHYTASVVKVPNELNATHEVTLSLGIANVNDEALEHLINVEIPYEAITSSSSQCKVIKNHAGDDMYTDSNGRITFHVYSLGTDPDVKECDISWIRSDGGIYLEY